MAQEPDIDVGAITEALNNKTDTDVQNTTDVGSAQIAHFAMPDWSSFSAMTLNASGSDYTAPEDGWFYLRKLATASGQFISMILKNTNFEITSYPVSDQYTGSVLFPVLKGQQITCSYTVAGSTLAFGFIYANGNKPQS